MTIEILPGHISDPDWTGPRCSGCGAVLGEGFVKCSDYAAEGLPPRAHLTMEAIPEPVRLKWFTRRIWGNAEEILGTLDGIEWMARASLSLGGLSPLDAVRRGKGMSVLELQFAEWPRLQKVADAERNRLAASRAA